MPPTPPKKTKYKKFSYVELKSHADRMASHSAAAAAAKTRPTTPSPSSHWQIHRKTYSLILCSKNTVRMVQLQTTVIYSRTGPVRQTVHEEQETPGVLRRHKGAPMGTRCVDIRVCMCVICSRPERPERCGCPSCCQFQRSRWGRCPGRWARWTWTRRRWPRRRTTTTWAAGGCRSLLHLCCEKHTSTHTFHWNTRPRREHDCVTETKSVNGGGQGRSGGCWQGDRRIWRDIEWQVYKWWRYRLQRPINHFSGLHKLGDEDKGRFQSSIENKKRKFIIFLDY